MKRFLKRAGALALSLILLLAMLPGGFVLPAEASSGDARTAYRKFIRQLVDKHGVLSGEWGEKDFHGVETVDFIDLTGDGRDELIVTWTERPDSSSGENPNEYLGIYTYSGGAVSELYRDYFATGGYAELVVLRQNGLVAVVYGMYRYWDTAIRWEKGRFVKGSDFTDSDRKRIEEASQGGGLVDEYGMISTIVMEHIGLDPNAPSERLLEVSRTMFGVEGTPAWVAELDIYDAGLSGGGPAWQLLNNIAYYGDRSKCKMNGKMAEAYADAIERLSAKNLYAALADIAGDGYPILITVHKSEYDIGRADDLSLWGYKNGAAYEVKQEITSWNSVYSGKLNGKGAIYSNITCADTYIPINDIYYTVSNGEIEAVHSILTYYAYEDSSEPNVAIGPAPSGAAYALDSVWYGLDLSKLPENGWILEREHAWCLVTDNGKAVTRQWKNGGLSGLGSHFEKERTIVITGGSCSPDECELIDTTSSSTAVTILRSYAAGQSAYPNFTKVTEDDDQYVKDLAEYIASTLGGEVVGIYKLADGVYYVIIVVNGAEQGALVRGVRENGKIVWKTDRKDDAPLSAEELDRLAAGLLSRPNMTLDYGKISGFSSAQDLLDHLQDLLDNMDGVTPNDAAKTELAAFIENSIANLCAGSVSGADNRLTADAAAPGDLPARAQSVWDDVEALLQRNDVALNKGITVIIRILWQNCDWSQPCQLTLDASLAEALKGCDVQFLLADGQHYIQLSASRLKTLLDSYGSLSIQLSKAGDTYTITFLDGEGAVVNQISTPVTVGLPAGSMTSTVMVSHSGGSDNWGGQYNPSAGVISVEIRYSGQYEVLENNVQIDDIGDLPEESQAAIRFLVSKGFLSLDGGSFNPSGTLTRYQFTQALVGMFFALDHTLTTSFEDVPADSEFYSYVASAEARGIVAGYNEVTFGGDDVMTVEQMLTLAARTLVDQKGYALPTDVEQYLNSFEDWETISGWALQHVAMSVRENLVERGGTLDPQAGITREQAAVILYRLFLLLYEVPPVALDLPPVTETAAGPLDTESGAPSAAVIAAAVGGVTLVGGGAGAAWYFLVKKKGTALLKK